MPKIHFLKKNKTFQVRYGNDFLQACKIDPSIPINFGCRDGKCAVCAINVIDGMQHLSKMTKQENETLKIKNLAKESLRLACQCAILGDITLE